MSGRVTITREDFKKKYYSMTTKDCAKELNVSIPTLMKTVKLYGIEKKKPGRPFKTNKIVIVEG